MIQTGHSTLMDLFPSTTYNFAPNARLGETCGRRARPEKACGEPVADVVASVV